jgi:alpha-L-fucosidase
MKSLYRAITIGIVAVGLLTPKLSLAEQASPDPTSDDQRMEWWRDARFGMFIHWGLYAIPAGEWNSEEVPGIGEWIMDKANISVEDYTPLARQFNPVKYDPAEWVRIAKQAGMKYVVITSKHHDGFCMFDTAATDWDIVDATPYGKDLLRPLAEECRKQGLKFCTYYSIMDWHHPSQAKKEGKKPQMSPSQKSEYVAYMKQQLRELLDTCDPDVLWFDGEWVGWWTEEDGQDLYAYLRELKPSLIINNRVGKGRKGMEGLNKSDREYSGDFGTPEQEIPATGVPGVDWESCMTMNDTWGYKKSDHNWKSEKKLLHNMIDIVSKGGNFLLNVGPTAAGEIPTASVERLSAMGRWMDLNSEAIYGATASPVKAPAWGRYTTKQAGDNKVLYAHIFEWPSDATISIPWEGSSTPKCTLVDGDQPLVAQRNGEQTIITLPSTAPDPVATVIRIESAEE